MLLRISQCSTYRSRPAERTVGYLELVSTTKSTALLSRSHTSFFHSVGAASVRLDCDKYFINRSKGFTRFDLHEIQCIWMLSRYCIRFTVDINYERWIQKFFTQWRLAVSFQTGEQDPEIYNIGQHKLLCETYFIDRPQFLWICNSLNIVHESVTIVC